MKLIKSVISVCLMVCLMFIAQTAATEIQKEKYHEIKHKGRCRRQDASSEG